MARTQPTKIKQEIEIEIAECNSADLFDSVELFQQSQVHQDAMLDQQDPSRNEPALNYEVMSKQQEKDVDLNPVQLQTNVLQPAELLQQSDVCQLASVAQQNSFDPLSNQSERHKAKTSKQQQPRNRKASRSHECDVCKKVFSSPSQLAMHYRIHTGKKPFECPVCQLSYRQKGHLKRHMVNHTVDKIYACDVCKQTFADRSTLRKHKLIHTSVESFECDLCHRSFARKYQIKSHKCTHDKKSLACEICNKTCISLDHLIVHKKKHAGKSFYRCDICKEGFISKRIWKKHCSQHKN